MPKSTPFAYNSFIKNIFLEIPGGYTYRHGSTKIDNEQDEDFFVGRKELLNSFKDVLKNGTDRGAYLVTGYRGMGKTSFVNKALFDWKKEESEKDRTEKNKQRFITKKENRKAEIAIFKLSLAQSELKDIDILKQIVNQLKKKIEDSKTFEYTRWVSLDNVFGWVLPIILLLLIGLSFVFITENNEHTSTVIENLLGISTASALFTLFVYKYVDWVSTTYGKLKKIGKIIFTLGILLILLYSFLSYFFIHLNFSIWATSIFISFLVNTLQLPAAYIPDHFLTFLIYVAVCLIIFGSTLKLLSLFVNLKDKKQSIKQIHRQLNQLHKRCNAQLTSEDQFKDSISSTISSLFKKDVLIFPIANAKEIETELISILENLAHHYRCVFVFDELDKVDPIFDNAAVNGNDSYGDKRTYLNDLRERRHTITHILGSLKYFINEAEARFIFIAGREMFEAALADISDRQSSISSIFHRVFYIDSFLKDQSIGESIASSIGVLVEEILYKLLLPNSLPTKNGKSDFFKTYYNQLIKKSTTNSNTNQSDKFTGDIEKEARKTIFVLQNFLGYLVYRSNGAPKKVMKLLEEYIVYRNLAEYEKNDKKIIAFYVSEPAQLNQHKHYLKFSYLDQYTLGFTAYLFQPFLTMYSSFMKRYSDGTLVSIPYLIDNLIKFHPFAFSAQNLELIPELMSSNKSPVSRPFLEELITFLGQNHIRRSESGLFDYKFYDRTHNEITFISKISEEESAAFNFTLDENFAVKSNLIYKIRQLREIHRSSENVDKVKENPLTSIIFLNRILGDVRFQDEEYEGAIVCYQDALQLLVYDRMEYVNHFFTFMQLRLKLGLTYEKIKAYEYAIGNYALVIEEGTKLLTENYKKHIIAYREILALLMQGYIATLYLQEKLQEGITFQKIKHTIDNFHSLIYNVSADYIHRDILLASFHSNIGTAIYYKNLILPQKVNELWLDTRFPKDDSIKIWIEQNKLSNVKGKQPVSEAKKKKDDAISAILNCFPSTIDRYFILISVDEVNKLSPDKIHFDSRISTSSYIYYKLTLKLLLGSEADDLISIITECARLLRSGEQDGKEQSYRSLQPIHRLTALANALAKMGDYLLPLIHHSVEVTEALGCFYNRTNPKKVNTEADARKELTFAYFGTLASKDFYRSGGIHPRLIIHIYYLAALFYLDAAESANAAFQLRKILVTLRTVKLSSNSSEKVGMILKVLEENLVKRILELSSWMSHSSDRPQLSKTKKYFDINTLRTPHDISSELYGNLSNNPDTKETILAYALLAMKYEEISIPSTTLTEHFEKFDEKNLLSPYNSISHFITRIMELELHTEINYKILKSYIENKFFIAFPQFNKNLKFTFNKEVKSWEKPFYYTSKLYDLYTGKFHERLPITENETEHQKSSRDAKEKEQAEFESILLQFDKLISDSNKKESFVSWLDEYSNLVVNSIFNLLQIDKIINTYGTNYILSNSYLAQIHEHLGTWLKHLHLCRILIYRFNLKELIEIDSMLNALVGVQAASSLDALTSYQMAMQYYYKAIQLHKEGDSYRNQINSLIYLEDDFNDNLYHFGAALERLKINSGRIRKKIDYLKSELTQANMYKYSTYIGGRN